MSLPERSISKQIKEQLKKLLWNSPLPDSIKEKIYYTYRGARHGSNKGSKDIRTLSAYKNQILENQFYDNTFSINYPKPPFLKLEKSDPKFIAFYLTQYYPDKHNEKWWGKGSTEWMNVAKAAPQYVGQDQPRMPGELGYYDLRIKENMYRQIELARIFGVYGFCFYYYWFDGERLLELPFNNFVNDEKIDFPFMICWANEDWTMQWSGSSDTPLVKQTPSVDKYEQFIHSCADLFNKPNYISVNGKPALIVYRPCNVPSPNTVLKYWRHYIHEKIGKDLYIIASIGHKEDYDIDFLNMGFDAVSEFSPNAQSSCMRNINESKEFVCDHFYGEVLDYSDFVTNKRYFECNAPKLYRAACPMWDNTARKKNKGRILDGATPSLFNQWLKDIVQEARGRKDLDEKFIFLNAWNEWAEGAYMEPDLKHKYGNLEAVKDTILSLRK